MTLLDEDTDMDFLEEEIAGYEAEHGQLEADEVTPILAEDCWGGCGMSCYHNCAVGCNGSCSGNY